MSRQKLQKPRPLGYVHYIPTTPQVNSLNITKLLPSRQSSKEKLKENGHNNVIELSASEDGKDTTVPVFEEPAAQNTGKRLDLSQHVNNNNHDKCKKAIDEGLKREKELRNQTEELGRQLEKLQVALCRQEEESKQLKNQLEIQEAQCLAQLSQEQLAHEETKTILHETKEKLKAAHENTEQLIEEHRQKIEEHKKESEKHLAEMMAEQYLLIADRDQKLARLKSQMADALKGNSWERQQQLDELTKELSRMQEENYVLRINIKSMKKSK